MFSTEKLISAGDEVILWFTRDSCKAITITPGETINVRFGTFRHSDLVGTPFGSKVASRNGKGFIYVLRPTPELWTLALRHRTQILYAADIAFVVAWLGIRPGSVVVEAGTGSGSFSHSVARTIGKRGHLHTFEFHEARCLEAEKEFQAHGMSEYVTVKHRNVCKSGFELDNVADAVFLDLPAPWEAIPSAKHTLKKTQTTRICCFSPCIEQVLRTVSALNDSHFVQITTYETLLRTIDATAQAPPKSLDAAVARIKESAVKKEVRRQKQIRAAQVKKGELAAGKRKVEEDEDEEEVVEGLVPHVQGTNDDAGEPLTKRPRVGSSPPRDAQPDVRPPPLALTPTYSHSTQTPLPAAPPSKLVLTRPFPEQRGHTSYLTFAVLLPTIYPGSDRVSSDSKDDATVGQSSTSTNEPTTTTETPSQTKVTQ
ncbi:tRNA (adenine-N(1)-)-methyltransferase catalytic subunit trm61 [Tulasnella sp. 403]|nr:tRNA (adenine-N(1)-)-methyltransferase catalytic subunit trm61 [Tulasnella sp. 403]